MIGPGAPDGEPAAVDLTVDLLGVAHRVVTTSARLGPRLGALLSGFPAAAGPAAPAASLVVVEGCDAHGTPWCVHRRGQAVHRAGDPGAVLGWLLADLNLSALEDYGGFAAHAGVVARHGRAVAFPAPSGAGKTTLTAAAVAAGFGYVSDEALCVDYATAGVQPYRRALVLSPWSLRAAGLGRAVAYEAGDGEVAVGPGLLGPGAGGAATGPEGARTGSGGATAASGRPGDHDEQGLRLAHVVSFRRRPGPPALVPASRADAMAWLIEYSFNHYKRPEASFHLCAALARQARAWRLELSDPAEAAALLRDRLGDG